MLLPVAQYPPVVRGPITTFGPFTIELRGGVYITSMGPVALGLPPTAAFEDAISGATTLATVLDERYGSSEVAWDRLTAAWNALSPGRSTVDLSLVAPYFPGGKLATLVLGWSIARLQGDQAMVSPDGRRLSIATATGFYQQPKNQHLRVYIPSLNQITSGWYAPMRIIPALRDNAGPPENVLDPALYLAVKEEAKQKFDVYPSAYANAWLVRTYKKRGGRYADSPVETAGTGGLTKWFGEEWVDLSRPIYDNSGQVIGFEPCGRAEATSQTETGDYPKCRPLPDAMEMTPKQRASAIRRKREAEADAPRSKGRSPKMVPTF